MITNNDLLGALWEMDPPEGNGGGPKAKELCAAGLHDMAIFGKQLYIQRDGRVVKGGRMCAECRRIRERDAARNRWHKAREAKYLLYAQAEIDRGAEPIPYEEWVGTLRARAQVEMTDRKGRKKPRLGIEMPRATDQCGAEGYRGRICKRPVRPGELCAYHQERDRCGAPTQRGFCKNAVLPGEKCVYHKEEK